VPINVQIVQAIKIDKLDFHRVCLQSEACRSRLFFLLLKVFMEMTLKSAGMFTNDMLKDVNIKFRL
ncbi:hypothetical protein AB1L12_25805, partial [Peribacillus frigoritolerans]|uniref:hypothetical protein n=1 Tax=Peribacillus frigoritolerans TaxID=450367 RepID=UPI00399F02AD